MRFYSFDCTDSTNEEAKRLIHSGALREPAWLLAREQTAGRGSRGRRWASPRDAGIYLTIVEVPVSGDIAQNTLLTLAAGVGCAEAIKRATGIDVRLKPINDLYVDGQKLGGILTETVVHDGTVEAVITGIGVNLRRADRPVLAGAAAPVSIEELLPDEVFASLDVEGLIASLVAGVRIWHSALLIRGAERIRQAWERYRQPGTAFPDWPEG